MELVPENGTELNCQPFIILNGGAGMKGQRAYFYSQIHMYKCLYVYMYVFPITQAEKVF